MEKEIKRAKIFICTFFVLFLMLFISVAVLVGIFKYSRTFTVGKWIDNPDERYKIVSNMLSEYDIIGMTESEIVSLLGKETENAPERFKILKGNFPDENNLTYALGVVYMDNEWLVITMEEGIAVSYEIGAT